MNDKHSNPEPVICSARNVNPHEISLTTMLDPKIPYHRSGEMRLQVPQVWHVLGWTIATLKNVGMTSSHRFQQKDELQESRTGWWMASRVGE